MKKFIVTYHAPMEALQESANTSPEDAKKGMEQWYTCAKKCGNKLVDMGQPLMGGLKLIANGSADSSNRQVCGYSILQAENINEAKKLMEGHPHLNWRSDCEIEIHETMPLPG